MQDPNRFGLIAVAFAIVSASGGTCAAQSCVVFDGDAQEVANGSSYWTIGSSGIGSAYVGPGCVVDLVNNDLLDLWVGLFNNSMGSLTIDGVVNADRNNFGYDGSATVLVTGTLTGARDALIGLNASEIIDDSIPSGDVTVRGSDASWFVDGSLWLGGRFDTVGYGSLSIEDGARVEITNRLNSGDNNNSRASLRVIDSTLSVGGDFINIALRGESDFLVDSSVIEVDRIGVGFRQSSTGVFEILNGSRIETRSIDISSAVETTVLISGGTEITANPDDPTLGEFSLTSILDGFLTVVLDEESSIFANSISMGASREPTVLSLRSGSSWHAVQDLEAYGSPDRGSSIIEISDGSILDIDGSVTVGLPLDATQTTPVEIILRGPGSRAEFGSINTNVPSRITECFFGSEILLDIGAQTTFEVIGDFESLDPTTTIRMEFDDSSLLSDGILVSRFSSIGCSFDPSFDPGLSIKPGDRFRVMTIGSDLIGDFADLPECTVVDILDGLELRITYEGGDGNDIELVATPPCPADLNADCALNFFDISVLLDQAIDYNNDERFDFFDISGFLQDFQRGCF